MAGNLPAVSDVQGDCETTHTIPQCIVTYPEFNAVSSFLTPNIELDKPIIEAATTTLSHTPPTVRQSAD